MYKKAAQSMKTEQPRGGERKKERERKAPLIRLELIAEPTGKRQIGTGIGHLRCLFSADT
jgi:hypothetical protein